MKKGMMLRSVLATAALASLSASVDAAESILYRNDLSLGTDYLGEAVNSGLYTVTSTTGSISGYDLSNYNIVVYANQDEPIPSGDLSQLDAYIAAGGHVIFDDWTQSNGFNGDQNFTGEINQTSLTLTMFDSGIVSPLAITNPGWGIFSTSMTALAGGVVGGTFGDGSDAIIVGNDGRTIVNGFLSDTVASEQLYLNELSSFGAVVPEPSTWAMMLAGFAGLGFVGYRASRRSAATAS
jgi:PEP-CTERM motif